MIELNTEQRQAMAQGQPVRIIDPLTQDAYVLVRAEDYARLWECRRDLRNSPIRRFRRWCSARNRRSGGICPNC